MISWFVFALFAAGFWGLTNVLDQIVQRNYAKDALSLTLVVALVRLPVGLLFFLIFGFYAPSLPIIFLSFLYGFLTILPVIFYLRALHVEEATRVMLFFQMIPVFVLILSSIFLGEVFSNKEMMAFFVLIFAGFLSVYRPGISSQKGGRQWSSATGFVLSAVFLWAFADVFLKYILQFYPEPQLLLPWSYIGSFLALFPLGLFPFVRRRLNRKLFSWFREGFLLFFLSVFTGALGFFSFFSAMNLGTATFTSALLVMQPLFVSLFIYILGKFFVSVPKENFRGRVLAFKFLSFVLSVAGIWLLNL